VNLWAQLIGVAIAVVWALVAGFAVFGALQALGLRLSQEDEFDGADLSIHHTRHRRVNWSALSRPLDQAASAARTMPIARAYGSAKPSSGASGANQL
jgi:hypothetical protein